MFLRVRRGLCHLFADIRFRIEEFATRWPKHSSNLVKGNIRRAEVGLKHLMKWYEGYEEKEM